MSLKSGSLKMHRAGIHLYLFGKKGSTTTYYYSTPRQEVSFVLEQLFGSVNFEKKKKKTNPTSWRRVEFIQTPPCQVSKALAEVRR